MLFGDEKRFQKTYVAHSLDNRIHGVKAENTDETVGPGSYFHSGLDHERNGWIKKSFSRRQPMTPPASARHSVFGRNDSYTTGVMTSYGALSAPMSPKDVLNSPGPGHYDKSVLSFGGNSRLSPNGRALTPRSSNSRPHSANNSVNGLSQHSVSLSTTKRFLFDQSATLKDGVLFLSAENNHKATGPGYYSFSLDTLVKPSHNVRAKSPSPQRSVISPRNSISSRPRSASSGRLRNF